MRKPGHYRRRGPTTAQQAEQVYAAGLAYREQLGPSGEAVLECIAREMRRRGRRVSLARRTIALEAGVATGRVTKTVRLLEQFGILVPPGRGRGGIRAARRPHEAESMPIPGVHARAFFDGALGHERRVAYEATIQAGPVFEDIERAICKRVRRDTEDIQSDLGELAKYRLVLQVQHDGAPAWRPTDLSPYEVGDSKLFEKVDEREERIARERRQARENGPGMVSRVAEDRYIREFFVQEGERAFDRKLPRPDERGPVLADADIQTMEETLAPMALNDIVLTGVRGLHCYPDAPSNAYCRILIRVLHEFGVTRTHRRSCLSGLRLRWEHIVGLAEADSYAPEKCGPDERLIDQYVRRIADLRCDLDDFELAGLYDELEMLGVTRAEASRRVMLEVCRREETVPDGRPKSAAFARYDRHPDCTAVQLATLPLRQMTAFELDAALEYAEFDRDTQRADRLREELAARRASETRPPEDLYHRVA